MDAELKKHVTKGVIKVHGSPSGLTPRGNFTGLFPFKTLEVGKSSQWICIVRGNGDEQLQANAALIAEAFTVFSETGMTPREMQEHINRLQKEVADLEHGRK